MPSSSVSITLFACSPSSSDDACCSLVFNSRNLLNNNSSSPWSSNNLNNMMVQRARERKKRGDTNKCYQMLMIVIMANLYYIYWIDDECLFICLSVCAWASVTGTLLTYTNNYAKINSQKIYRIRKFNNSSGLSNTHTRSRAHVANVNSSWVVMLLLFHAFASNLVKLMIKLLYPKVLSQNVDPVMQILCLITPRWLNKNLIQLVD